MKSYSKPIIIHRCGRKINGKFCVIAVLQIKNNLMAKIMVPGNNEVTLLVPDELAISPSELASRIEANEQNEFFIRKNRTKSYALLTNQLTNIELNFVFEKVIEGKKYNVSVKCEGKVISIKIKGFETKKIENMYLGNNIKELEQFIIENHLNKLKITKNKIYIMQENNDDCFTIVEGIKKNEDSLYFISFCTSDNKINFGKASTILITICDLTTGKNTKKILNSIEICENLNS